MVALFDYDGFSFRPEVIDLIVIDPQPNMFIPAVTESEVFNYGKPSFRLLLSEIVLLWSSCSLTKKKNKEREKLGNGSSLVLELSVYCLFRSRAQVYVCSFFLQVWLCH